MRPSIKGIALAGALLLVLSAAAQARCYDDVDGGKLCETIPVDRPGGSVAGATVPTGGATSVNQTTLNTEVGPVNETAPATDTAASGTNGRLQRVSQRLTSLILLFSSPIQVSGSIAAGAMGGVQGNFSRPATTPTYSSGQAVCTSAAPCTAVALSLSRTGTTDRLRLSGLRMIKNATGTTGAQFRVWLFSDTPTLTGINDTSAFTPLWADRTIRLGYVDCLTPIANSDNVSYACSAWSNGGASLDAVTNSSGNIYLFVTALGAYVGETGATFFFDMTATQY